MRTCDSRICHVGLLVGWSVTSRFWIASSFGITAPAHPSATEGDCIWPCYRVLGYHVPGRVRRCVTNVSAFIHPQPTWKSHVRVKPSWLFTHTLRSSQTHARAWMKAQRNARTHGRAHAQSRNIVESMKKKPLSSCNITRQSLDSSRRIFFFFRKFIIRS